ncbi:putative MFS family arabinose efflux permease [Rathayibacter agropyri]
MFAIGTDGYVIAGLLPEIATTTGVNISVAGQLITVFAIVYAVMSPVLASVLGYLDRRTLLLLSLVVFALGNAIVASSQLYSVLVIGRVVAAIGASMFTPAALTITGGLVGPARRGRSIALVTSGLTVATVAGVPLGIGLSTLAGYHGVFWIIAGLSVAVLLAVAIWFAPVAAPPAVSVSTRLRALGSEGVGPTLLVSLLVFTGAFTVYNYIAEYFATRVGIPGSALPWILLAFGVGGAVGNLVGGTMTDRIGAQKTVVVSAGALSVSFVLLWAAGSIAPVALVATMMWGVSGWLLAPAQQHRLLALGGPAAPLLVSLNASAMYLGMGLSGALGGFMVATVGVEQLPLAGIAAAVASLIVAALGYRRSAPASA